MGAPVNWSNYNTIFVRLLIRHNLWHGHPLHLQLAQQHRVALLHREETGRRTRRHLWNGRGSSQQVRTGKKSTLLITYRRNYVFFVSFPGLASTGAPAFWRSSVSWQKPKACPTMDSSAKPLKPFSCESFFIFLNILKNDSSNYQHQKNYYFHLREPEGQNVPFKECYGRQSEF